MLKRDAEGAYWLENAGPSAARIEVEDAPFIADTLEIGGSGKDQLLRFHTNVDDVVTADGDHPIRVSVDTDSGEPRPYVLVRGGLEARITRAVFYELADIAVEGTEGRPTVLGGLEWWQILSPRPAGSFDAAYLTAEFIARRLGADGASGVTTLAEAAERLLSDYDLDRLPHAHAEDQLTAASVLVPIVERSDGLTLILTLRTSHLSSHAGQISFPGGRQEAEDADETAAALREAEEEIGLAPDKVRVIGRLGPYVTRTGYRVTPIVGLLRPPLELKPDPHEVAEIFEVPLAFVVDPANHTRASRTAEGVTRSYYVLPYENRHIWGATAGMLVNFARLLVQP